jgi:DNA-binding beta-propeller fold protein YncE
MTNLKSFLAGAMLCAVVPAWGSQAYVSTHGPGGAVSTFNFIGGAMTGTYATPPGTTDIVLSANGMTLFAGTTNTAQNDIPGGSPTVVKALDPATGAVKRTYPMPASVVKMVLNRAGDHIYATGSGTNGAVLVMSLNLLTGAAASAAVPGTQAFDLYTLAVSPDGSTVYVPGTNQIDIFRASTLAFLGTIPLANNGIVAPPAVTLDGSTLLAAGRGGVYVVDLASKTLKTTVAIATSAYPFGSVLSPDGKTFYVSGGTLSAIGVASLTVTGSVALNQTNPFRLAISPGGSTLFASDLTYATIAIVDAASMTVKGTLRTVGDPYALAVTRSQTLLVLNENANPAVLADTAAMTAPESFFAGTDLAAPVSLAGKLFVPEAGNVAVQESPSSPVLAKPIADNFILPTGAAALGGKLYVASGSAVRVIDPATEKATGSIFIRTGGGSAISIAASGDGRTLLASYEVLGIGIVLVDSGIVTVNTSTAAQKILSSFPYVPGAVASNPAGTRAYSTGFTSGSQIGVWDTQNNVFLSTATIPGNPFYVALAVSADGNTVYLADRHGKVDFVNASSLQLILSVPAGTNPSGICVNSTGSEALITDSSSTSVTVLDLTRGIATGTIPAGYASVGCTYIN